MSEIIVSEVSAGRLGQAVERISAPFRGYGMERVPGLRTLYNALYSAVSPNGIRDVEVGDSILRVDFRDRSIVPSLWILGEYERTYSRALSTLVNAESKVIDVGAHVGYFTVRFALQGAEVLAIEPCSQNQDLLRHNLQENLVAARSKVLACALGDTAGTATLWIDSKNTGAAALTLACVDDPIEGSEVQVEKLDDTDLEWSPTLMKIDVQGAEAAVIRGADRTIRESRPTIAFEYNIAQIEAYGDEPRDALQQLDDLEYRFYLADEHRGVVRLMTPERLHSWCLAEKRDGTGFANVIARPADSGNW